MSDKKFSPFKSESAQDKLNKEAVEKDNKEQSDVTIEMREIEEDITLKQGHRFQNETPTDIHRMQADDSN